MLYTNIREIINNLVTANLATLAYYDHEPVYYSSNPLTYHEQMKGYDGNDEFYKQYEPCLVFAGHGDYVGSTLDMANMRVIEENYPELIESGGIIYDHQGYGYSSLVIFFLRPSVLRSGIFDDLEGLEDYPLLDDESLSEIEQELLEQAWENWGRSDFESELEKLTDIIFYNTDWQDALFWELLRHGTGCEYHAEGTDVWINFKEVLAGTESLVQLIIDNEDELESGESELIGEWKDGLKWECKPINQPLKLALQSGIQSIVPIHKNETFCTNCNDYAVMQVQYKSGSINTCANCHNKLMEYWPKCKHCNVNNAIASLQPTLFSEVAEVKMYCLDCKNSLSSL